MDTNNELVAGGLKVLNDWSTPAIILICACFTLWSIRNVLVKNKIDNNAQYVVSLGVLGTFIGILVGLLNFKTGDSKVIMESINYFLGGMKIAFFTSVTGMICSLIIKGFQGKLEEKQSATTEKSISQLNYLAELQKSNEAIKESNNELKEVIIKSSENTEQFMNNIMISVNNMAVNTAATQSILNEVSNGLMSLTEVMQNSSQAGIAKSVQELTTVIASMEATTKENNEMTARMAEVMNKQNEQITILKDTMVNNGEQQLANLEAMKANSLEMKTLADNSYAMSQELFNKTVEFQANMAASSARQEAILSENNQGLQDMRKSFDQFLEQVADNFSKSFIEALTQSIERLNVELQEQLGGNFQKLNQAVTDLLDWQINYKGIIENSYSQLSAFLESTKEFEKHVGETMPALLSQMDSRIANFDNTVEKLGEAVVETDSSLAAFKQQLQEKLANYAEDMAGSLQANNAAITSHLNDVMTELKHNMNNYNGKMLENIQNSFEYMNNDIATTLQQNNATIVGNLNNSLGQLKEIFDRFNDVLLTGVSGVNTQLRDTMNEYKNSMLENLHASFSGLNDNVRGEMGKTFNTLMTAMGNSINEFYAAQGKLMVSQQEKFMASASEILEKETKEINNKVAQSMRNFDDTLNVAVDETMDAVKNDFEKMIKNVDAASEQQVKELGASLVAITQKMASNYKVLMDEIAKLHNVLVRNGEL